MSKLLHVNFNKHFIIVVVIGHKFYLWHPIKSYVLSYHTYFLLVLLAVSDTPTLYISGVGVILAYEKVYMYIIVVLISLFYSFIQLIMEESTGS